MWRTVGKTCAFCCFNRCLAWTGVSVHIGCMVGWCAEGSTYCMFLQGTITHYSKTAPHGRIYRGDDMYDGAGVCRNTCEDARGALCSPLEHRIDMSEAGGRGDLQNAPGLQNGRIQVCPQSCPSIGRGGGGGCKIGPWIWEYDSFIPRRGSNYNIPAPTVFVRPIGNRCNRRHVNLVPNNRGWN